MYDGTVKVSSWVAIHDGCPISYEICGSAGTRVQCGKEADGFEFEIDSEALRELLRLGDEALREMDAIHEKEQAATQS